MIGRPFDFMKLRSNDRKKTEFFTDSVIIHSWEG